jgi:hypothetical protein
MKKLRNLTIVAAAFFLTISAASAQVSIGAGVSNVGGDGVDFTGGAVDVTGKFNDYLGWSVATQIGGSDDAYGVSADLDYFMAAKLRAGISVGEGFLFVTAGYGGASLEGTVCYYGCRSETVTESDFIYGVGTEFFFCKDAKWGFSLEYNSGAGDLDDLDQFMATIRYRF